MKTPPQSLLALGLIATVVTACAGDKDAYPSLAIRDLERASPAPASPAPPTPLSGTTARELRDLTQQAQAANQEFLAAQPEALQLARAASGTARESDIRARALVAAAGLSTLRGKTSVALSRIDQLEASSAAQFVELAEIRAAQAEIKGMIAVQDQALSSLKRSLGL